VGVGGCASQAVSKLFDSGTHANSLDLLVLNTDIQELSYNWMPDANKLLLGTKAANWTSTRGDADIGKVRVC
jgi:cell division GTPase FtsZ